MVLYIYYCDPAYIYCELIFFLFMGNFIMTNTYICGAATFNFNNIGNRRGCLYCFIIVPGRIVFQSCFQLCGSHFQQVNTYRTCTSYCETAEACNQYTLCIVLTGRFILFVQWATFVTYTNMRCTSTLALSPSYCNICVWSRGLLLWNVC